MLAHLQFFSNLSVLCNGWHIVSAVINMAINLLTHYLHIIKYRRFSTKTHEFIKRRKQKHTCFTAAEKRWSGTAALVDGGVGGTDEQTPNVVISTPTYAGQANKFNYSSNTHAYEHYWWCSTTSRKYPQPSHLKIPQPQMQSAVII